MLSFNPRVWQVEFMGAALFLIRVRPVQATWRSLTGPAPGYAATRSGWAISPASRRAVFVADVDTDERYEPFRVLITGTMPLKLNPPSVAGGEVRNLSRVSADSPWIVYEVEGLGGNGAEGQPPLQYLDWPTTERRLTGRTLCLI